MIAMQGGGKSDPLGLVSKIDSFSDLEIERSHFVRLTCNLLYM